MPNIGRTDSAAVEKAEALCLKMKPLLIEMIERYGSSNREVTFNDIEADAASRGDLLARELVKLTLRQQDESTEQEVKQARQLVVDRRGSDSTKVPTPEELCLTRIPNKERRLKTARGEIDYGREYLYFPELKSGIFPPGRKTRHTVRRNYASGSKTAFGKNGR